MPYAMYLRKSRADADAEARGEGETLARHKTILSALAARNGHVIDHVYQEVVSGETISARPYMQQLLSDVGAGKWEGVYVADVERLARGDTMDQGRVAQTFMFSGTRIVTPAKTYDPSNEIDVEYFEFSLFMSRREYKTINRRIQAGRMQSVREGKYIGSRPTYGYRKVKIAGDKGFTLEPIAEEAEVVRQVFSWYLHGDDGRRMGLTRIANRLLDMRVDPGEQGGSWKPCRIYRMLTNEVYIGMIRWGRVRTRRALTESGVEKSLHMTDDYELHPGLHPAIVDKETYDAVQQRLPCGYTPLQTGKQLSNPLAGLVVCGECGHTLRGKPAAGRQPALLFCATHGCRTVRTARQAVEEAILGSLRAWLADYETQTVSPTSPPREDGTAAILDRTLSALQGEHAALREQKGKLHDLLERGIYTPEVFAERITDIAARLRTTDQSIEAVRAQQAAAAPKHHTVAELAPELRHVLDTYDAAETAQQKNDLLRRAISKVEYTKRVKGNQWVDPEQFELVVWPKIK